STASSCHKLYFPSTIYGPNFSIHYSTVILRGRTHPGGTGIGKCHIKYGSQSAALYPRPTQGSHCTGSRVRGSQLYYPSTLVRCPPCHTVESRWLLIGGQCRAVMFAPSPPHRRRYVDNTTFSRPCPAYSGALSRSTPEATSQPFLPLILAPKTLPLP